MADQIKSKAEELKASIPPASEIKEQAKESAKEATNDLIHSARAFAAGGVGGVCAVLTGHPFDLVKVRLQTAEKGAYNGAIDVVKKILARGGPAGLYAGVTAPLYGVTPMFAISFWGYDLGKNLVRRFSTMDSTGQFSIAQISVAGAFSAVPMTVITAPMERVKVLLQIQKPGADGKLKYNGSFDCAKQLFREGGIRSVYRGTFMTLARDAPGSAAYFAAYEVVKRKLTPKDPVTGLPGTLSLPAVCAAGATAGVAMWLPVFPVDTVKSRLQSMPGNPTLSGVVSSLWKANGIKAFFPGFAPAIARAIPANAATFLGVELAQQAMGKFLD